MNAVRPIDTILINFQSEWVRANEEKITTELDRIASLKDKNEPIAKCARDNISLVCELGGFKLLFTHVSAVERESYIKTANMINNYFEIGLFIIAEDYIENRGAIYYSASLYEEDNTKAVRFITELESISAVIENTYKNDMDLFFTLSLIDLIRFKMLQIKQANLSESLSIDLDGLILMLVRTQYNYFLNRSAKVSTSVIKETLKSIRSILMNDWVKISKIKPRAFKEFDDVKDVVTYILKSPQFNQIKSVVGIAFGGIEMPYIMKSFLAREAKIYFCKTSSYNNQNNTEWSEIIPPESRDILICDDNVLTGRTLARVRDELTAKGCSDIYFTCYSFADSSRVKQMTMKNHGSVNYIIIEMSHIITTSRFTKITTSNSYFDNSGIFDIRKEELKTNLMKHYPTYNFNL